MLVKNEALPSRAEPLRFLPETSCKSLKFRYPGMLLAGVREL